MPRSYGTIIAMWAFVLPLVLMLSLSAQRSPDEAFVEVGVWYAGPDVEPPAAPAADLATLRSDLADIRRAGFNGITTWIAWRDAEPRRGSFTLSGLERLVAAAAAADLKISLVVYDDPPPAWAASDRDASEHFLATVHRGTELVLWDLAAGCPVARWATPSRARIEALAFASDDAFLVTAAQDGLVEVWSLARPGERIATGAIPGKRPDGAGLTRAITVTADGARIIVLPNLEDGVVVFDVER